METDDGRINKILEILLKYIDKDFSHTIPISKNEDEIDALSAGLNTMAEELQAYISETTKQAEQIKKMNAELEQKVIERTDKLEASEHEYRSLIEQATDGIFISDQAGKYLDVNLSACKMLGYSKEELLKMSVHDVMLRGDVKENPPRFNELLAGNTVLSTRNLLRKDGTVVPVEINGKMLPNGKILGMVRDITDRKAAEEKLKSSEARFRNLTETAFDAIVIMNEQGKIVFWNRAAEMLFGYSQDEVQQKTLTVIMPDQYRDKHQQGIERYLKTGEKRVTGKVIALEGRRKNGEIFPIEVSITGWETGEGKMFSGIIRDITERKVAEDRILKLNESLEGKVAERTAELENKIRQLKESEEKFQKAFQASAAGITITRLSDTTYLDVNDAFLKITGYTKSELIGHSSAALGIVTDTTTRVEALRQMQQYGSLRQFEMNIVNKSGHIVNALSSVETIYLNGEKYAINIIYDITDRKKAEEQLHLVNKELESFSYSVSHDLRAPLRSISGYTKILEEDFAGNLEAEGKRILGIVQKNVNKMNQLIDHLLEFSRIGKKELVRSNVDTEKIVRNAIATIENSVKHHASFLVKPLFPVSGDENLLAQVWVNLISNAVKYSSKRDRPEIEIGARREATETIFYVKDNGAGFDMDYANKLFEVFQRLHRVQDFEGTGIGLSIVKRIITKHGGRVWAEGAVDKGATFYFSLDSMQQ